MWSMTLNPKAAIVGLIRGYGDLQSYFRVIRRNKLLHKNFNARYGYPVILFHEGNVCQEHRDYMSRSTPNLTFVDVGEDHFSRRPGVDQLHPADLGYRHMCRFYALGIYDYLTDYDYVMRLDDDSYIESKIGYNIFEFMRSNDLDYGYVKSEYDTHAETMATLPDFVRKYVLTNQITMNCDFEAIDCLHYYSNFHVTRVSFWLRNDVQKFLEAIDNDGGIYRYRWGDHVIQTLALKIYSHLSRIHLFEDFKYTHYSHRWSNFEWSWWKTAGEGLRKDFRRMRRRMARFF